LAVIVEAPVLVGETIVVAAVSGLATSEPRATNVFRASNGLARTSGLAVISRLGRNHAPVPMRAWQLQTLRLVDVRPKGPQIVRSRLNAAAVSEKIVRERIVPAKTARARNRVARNLGQRPAPLTRSSRLHRRLTISVWESSMTRRALRQPRPRHQLASLAKMPSRRVLKPPIEFCCVTPSHHSRQSLTFSTRIWFG